MKNLLTTLFLFCVLYFVQGQELYGKITYGITNNLDIETDSISDIRINRVRNIS